MIHCSSNCWIILLWISETYGSVSGEKKIWNAKTAVWSLYPKVAPQFGHRLWRSARQKMMPMGKKNIAHRSPKQVKSSSSTPTLRKRNRALMHHHNKEVVLTGSVRTFQLLITMLGLVLCCRGCTQVSYWVLKCQPNPQNQWRILPHINNS